MLDINLKKDNLVLELTMNLLFRSCLQKIIFVFGAFLIIFHSPAFSNEQEQFAKSVPIADMHMHLFGKRPIFYKELMDRNGVKWGGGVGGSIFDDQEGVSQLLGDRYIKTLGQKEFVKVFFQQGESGLLNPNDPDFVQLFSQAEQEFKSGKAYGFGEIHGNNRRSHGPRNERFARKISLKSPVISRMFEVANRYEKFIQLHIEGEDDTLRELSEQMALYPKALVILSHCLPYSGPNTLRELFRNHKNLLCEVSAGGPVHKVARIFNNSGISQRYETLIREFPDRFLLGTDPCCGLDHLYDEMISELRLYFLANLPKDVAEKIAYKNVIDLLGLKN